MKLNVLDMIGIGIFVMAVLLIGIAFAFAEDMNAGGTNYIIPCVYWAKTSGFMGIMAKEHSADFSISTNIEPKIVNASRIFRATMDTQNTYDLQKAMVSVMKVMGDRKPAETGISCEFLDGVFLLQAKYNFK
ncbi:MAG: hypothetical protein ACPLGZ_00030 [Candidatus Pelagibacter ubique]